MKILTKKAVAVAVAVAAASAANATVCTNPALTAMSTLTGVSAPTIACVNNGVDVFSPTKTNVATPVVTSKTAQSNANDQSGYTQGTQNGTTAVQGGNSVGDSSASAGQISAYQGMVKTGSLSQDNTVNNYGAMIGSNVTQTALGTTGAGDAVNGNKAGFEGNVGSSQTATTGSQSQGLGTSLSNSNSNQAASKNTAKTTLK